MNEYWLRKEERSCALPKEARTILTLLIFCWTNVITAQDYLGLGLHLTPPIQFDFTHNPYVVATPLPGIGGSLTYKKEWELKRNGMWYAEAGLTLQGLRYYQVNYIGDSITIWSDGVNRHTGFPGILTGAGRSWAFKNDKDIFSVGGELLFLFNQDLDRIISSQFGIINHPVDDAVFPIFPRLNLGYNRKLTFFRTIPAQLQIYAALSFQDFTKGTQYILDRETGEYTEGEYYVNNSDFGIKLFTSLNINKYEKTKRPASIDDGVLAQAERKKKFRISVSGQFFGVPATVYHIPQVDSFSLSSRLIMLPQLGIVAEIPHKRNDLWNTIIGLGIGRRAGTLVFKSDGNFPANKQPINFEQSVDIGHYGIINLGLSRRHTIKRQILSHMLTATVVVPLEKEYVYLGVPLVIQAQPIPYENAILEGWVDYANGREKVLFGVEYNPELIFRLREPVFIALGLVANYSFGGVIGHGTYTVYNDYTTYYGASLQKFAKLGVSMRIGFER